MRVVFLQDDFPPRSAGGAGFSTFELAEGVKKAGHEVFVIATVKSKSEEGESEYQGLKVFTIASDYHERWRAWRSLYNPGVVRQVEALLKQIQPDVVHANNIHYHLSYACLKVAKRYAKAVVWTARDAMAFSYGKVPIAKKITWLDNLKQAKKRYNPFRNFFIRQYLRCADKLFAVSGALKGVLEQNGIHPVEVLHTGMNVEAWKTTEEAVSKFRIKYGLVGKKAVVLGGRLSEGKGEPQAREAIALVAKQMPEVVLLIMGQGASGQNIICTDWITGEEKVAAYSASDAVWVPSTYFDAFPRMVLEAMAAGKPVVGTCFGGVPEAIVDGVTGYMVNPFDPQEIADKTLDLLQNPEKALAFGKAGRERIKTEFNIDDKVAQLIACYQKLIV